MSSSRPSRQTAFKSGSVRDADGFAPIGDYAAIGDGRGVALVAADGAIDWWAVPRLDSPPPFAAIVDPGEGGRIELRPTDDDWTVTRRYVQHTNVFETTFTTASGRVRITDSLNSGNAGALPWSELARRIDGLDGRVAMRWAVVPGSGLGEWSPWVQADGRGPVIHAGPLTMGVRCSPAVEVESDDGQVTGRFVVSAGERVMVAVLASESSPLFLSDVDAIDQRMDLSIASWRHWARQVRWDGPREQQVVRSALALKLLLMAGTGAIAAAATTSLPEKIGGSKNWDYRFAWVRDAALTIGALAACKLEEEVHAAIVWLLRTIRENGPEIDVVYTLDGRPATTSRIVQAPGYRGSGPVRIGNDATDQLQIGVYGDLFGIVAAWVFDGHVLDVGTARQLADLADRCADLWRRDDAGIWELQPNRPYTSSKMNCWRALDRAAKLAAAGHLDGGGRRWRAEADAIASWIGENCWSEDRRSYVSYAGAEELDASVMLGAPWGFDSGQRMSSTIDAISRELAVGPLLYRYSGVHREEQAFLACSYWKVQALVVVGRHAEAEELMTELDSFANPFGLLTEMATPGSGELVGNLPQALSHLTLINAVAMLRDGPSQ